MEYLAALRSTLLIKDVHIRHGELGKRLKRILMSSRILFRHWSPGLYAAYMFRISCKVHS